MTTPNSIVTLSLWMLLSSISASGQTIYRANREAYQSNNYEHDFILFSDSTCFIKGHYRDGFSKYSLYKGHLEKINDTLYEFSYQPVVEFGCNKRLYWRQDSVRFNISQTDTTILPIAIDIKVENNNRRMVELKESRTTVFLIGAGQYKFTLDTEFTDPITKMKVIMTVEPHSEPDLTYYGTKTGMLKIKLSIVNDVLTIYSDKEHIWDKDTFVKITTIAQPSGI